MLGTLGADNTDPIEVMVFFITLAYIALSIDASGAYTALRHCHLLTRQDSSDFLHSRCSEPAASMDIVYTSTSTSFSLA